MKRFAKIFSLVEGMGYPNPQKGFAGERAKTCLKGVGLAMNFNEVIVQIMHAK